MNLMNGTSIGIVNSQKTKICSGNKPRISVCILYKVLFGLK